MNRCIVTIKARVNPTESAEKVKEAVRNLFPDVSVEIISQGKGRLLLARADQKGGLACFYNRLREEKILAAARRVLRQGATESSLSFCLNKQAAYMKRISFSAPRDESPLGPIEVEVECDCLEDLIDWLSPKTVKTKRTRKI